MAAKEGLLLASRFLRQCRIHRAWIGSCRRRKTRMSMSGRFFLVLPILAFSLDVSPVLGQTKLSISFSLQDGVYPSSIKIESMEGKFSKEIKFSDSNRQIVLTAKDFAKPLERFSVTVNYGPSDTLDFELRTTMPLTDLEEKEILLVKPKKTQNYKNIQDAIELLKDKRKGFEPYVVCRQSYFAAQKLGDKQSTQMDAAFCWLLANARLVFADPESSRRLYAPDRSAIDEIEKILTAIDDRSSEESENWRKGLEKSKYSKELKKVQDEIARLKLAHWVFFAAGSELRTVHGWPSFCNFMALFREELATLSADQKSRLAQPPFKISQQAMTTLEAGPTLVSTDPACSGGRNL